jgi:polysaccharide export outer membrane protein
MGIRLLNAVVIGSMLAAASASGQTAPRPAQPPVTDAVPAPQDNYVIGAQDQLSITVFEEPGLTGKYRVENDGFFTFPLLDRVQAAGRTLKELQTSLTSLLSNGYLRNPQVRVEIDQYKSQRVFVSGAVRTPGPILMSGSTMTLLEALALAGSPTPDASSEVIVVHPAQPGQTEGEQIRVNRRDLELGRAGADVSLRDGTIINVPTAQRFYVDGQVRNPGYYVLDPGTTVQQAIVLAGGLSDRGSDRGITATRLVNGKTTEVPLRLEDKVLPNDVIRIRSRFF